MKENNQLKKKRKIKQKKSIIQLISKIATPNLCSNNISLIIPSFFPSKPKRKGFSKEELYAQKLIQLCPRPQVLQYNL